ncbi:MAG: hypothetical protein FWE98_06325 [Oscillospiraceae bacterium]|nr:hypothetical protein [Oscillospiraceae bacterium]
MNNNGISRRPALVGLLFAAGMLLLLLPLRLWQQLRLVEDLTGFWMEKDFTVVLLYIGLGLLAALPCAAALALRGSAVLDLTRRCRTPEGVTAGLAALALAWDAVMAFGYAARLFSGQGGAVFSVLEEQSPSLMAYYIRSGAMACLLEGVFGFLSAVFFLRLAAIDVRPQKNAYLGRALALAPFAWCVCRILRRFSRTIAYLKVSDLFLSLAMLAALMIFLLAFAQNVAGRTSGYKPAALLAAGIPAAVLALLCFVPRVVAYGLFGSMSSSTIPQDALIEWCDPAMAAFVLAFVGGRVKNGQSIQAKQ